MHQDDFNYSEKVNDSKQHSTFESIHRLLLLFKVERYLTHLNHGALGVDTTLSDEGVYGSSDISSDQLQQFPNRAPSILSMPFSAQQHYQDSLKRFEQLYSLVEHRPSAVFTSDSLYV
jgi:hypothetical protein